jgi:hypothetical protein
MPDLGNRLRNAPGDQVASRGTRQCITEARHPAFEVESWITDASANGLFYNLQGVDRAAV